MSLHTIRPAGTGGESCGFATGRAAGSLRSGEPPDRRHLSRYMGKKAAGGRILEKK